MIAAAVLWVLASPLFRVTRANEARPESFSIVVKEGTWKGRDEVHFASGVAKILSDGGGNYLFRLEDFRVQNGPDIEFFLSADATYGPEDVALGDVPATSGDYHVGIPAGTDLDAVGYAIVWCVPFGVLFATAELA